MKAFDSHARGMRATAPDFAGWTRALALGVTLACAACTQTPLNVAPVVDLSHANGIRPGAPRPAAADAGQDTYVVQKGDTLFHIAMTFHCGLRDLARWNGIGENAQIQVGQRLYVRDPAAPAAPVAAAEPAAAPGPGAAATDAGAPGEAEVQPVPLAVAPAVQTRPLDNVAPLAPLAPLAPAAPAAAPMAPPGAPAPGSGAVPAAPAPPPALAAISPTPTGNAWLWPVDGSVVVKFDPVHGKGVDIGVGEDAPVRAVADGEVSYTGSPLEWGNLVVLTHANGLRTVYAHNKTIVARQGQRVTQGQVIATAGKTGATPPILHFEVRLKGIPVNPLDYLPPR